MMLLHSTPDDTFITRLSPLIKVLLLVTTAVFAFFTSNILILSLYLLIVTAGIRFFNIDFGRALLLVKLFLMGLPVLITLFILSYLWREPTYYEGFMTGSAEGIRYALRFMNLILVNFAVVLSTDPREIVCALRAVRLPVLLSQILAHVINLLPRLLEEVRAIAEAQTARGMRWKNLWRPSRWIPVTLPVIMAAMRFSEQTAISIELRGGLDDSPHRLPRLTRADWLVGVVCAVIIGLSVWG
jgi:energy-coupling factor transport system permease protein